jgi:VWFA-related protein
MEDAQVRLMRRLSGETGGDSFERSKRSLSDIYDAIEEELRLQYSIGFTPSSNGPGYRRIRVTATRPGLMVRTRDGYYAE